MPRRDSIPAPLQLSLSGLTAVHDAVAAARAFADTAVIDPAAGSRLAVLIEELVTNLYDHGGLASDQAFGLELACANGQVTLILLAPGPEFDPRGPSPRRTSSAGAGAGLKLVKAWSRRLEHAYVDGHNRLFLTLPVS